MMSDIIVGGKYRIRHKIGSGSFGDIYLGVNIHTKEQMAIKLENKNTKYPQLMYEYKVYCSLKPSVGFPSVYWCGTAGKCNVMVMDLLGDSLESLYNKCGRKFSLKTVLMLAIQLIDRIEHQHNNHFLHRDIKPDNFLMGLNDDKNIVYVIDMGLSKRYRHPNTLEHIPYRDNKKFTGTPRYASINTHHGIEQCRRDDLESLGYMLMYFNLGKLPWQGLKARTKQEKYDKIGSKKMNVTVEQLCKNFPKEFALYLNYCRQLRFSQKPNYQYLRCLFSTLFKNCQYKDDWVFDWMRDEEGTNKNLTGLTPRGSQNKPIGKGGIDQAPFHSNGAQLLEAYGKLEAERDKWKHKCKSQERYLLRLKSEVMKLRRHISLYSTQPYEEHSSSKPRSSTITSNNQLHNASQGPDPKK